MSNICLKENLDINKLIFLYNVSEINKEKNIEEIINEEDRRRESMNILVFHIYEDVKSNNIIKSNEVICPECKEITFIQLKDFKINLFGCKNGHKMNNLSLQDYEKLQNVDISEIICQSCRIRNKGIIYNNEFYRYLT